MRLSLRFQARRAAHAACPLQARRGKSSRSNAFTLIEILVVVVILGIAAAIVAPNIGTRDDLKCAAAARVIMADIIYTQNRAIALQATQYIAYSTTNQNYSVQSPYGTTITSPITQNSFTTTFGANGSPGLQQATLTSVNFGSSQTVLAFDILGSPYGYNIGTGAITSLSSAGTIVVTSGQVSMTISIEPDTGELSAQ